MGPGGGVVFAGTREGGTGMDVEAGVRSKGEGCPAREGVGPAPCCENVAGSLQEGLTSGVKWL